MSNLQNPIGINQASSAVWERDRADPIAQYVGSTSDSDRIGASQ
jgi:hypothetical protein